jgi:hypothetical protein
MYYDMTREKCHNTEYISDKRRSEEEKTPVEKS